MNVLAHTALARRIAWLILVLACACLGGSASQPASAAPLPPPERVLVYVPLPSNDALDSFVATGLPAYAQVEAKSGTYLLTVTDAAGLRQLTAAGLAPRILDADIAGATYYFAIVPPGRPQPHWLTFGTVLLQDNAQTLIRATPANAAILAEQGVELVQLSPAPIVIQWLQSDQAVVSTTITAGPLVQESHLVWLPLLLLLRNGSATTTADPLVQGMIDQVTTAAVQGYEAQLSGITPIIVEGAAYTLPTRYTDSGAPIQKATQYIGEHLADLGLSVEFHQWNETKPPNVIGQITGETAPGQIFVIGAHLDDMPSGLTAPGADDNASGSAATLVAADILSQYEWGCTLRLAFWTGEEQGLLGSGAYAARAKTNNETIKGYLNLDMLGYNAAPPRNVDLYYQATPSGSEQIADIFMGVVSAYGLNLNPVKYDVATYSTGRRSDNASFWNQGYPAILAIEDYEGRDFTPNYHTTNDTLSTLDMDYLTTIVKASVGTFAHMSGCLLTGALGGGVTAGHDGLAIAGASIAITDTHDLTYSAGTDGAGHFGRTLPAATYDMTTSAYGYLPATVTGVSLPTGGVTQDFVLQAAPPAAPQVSISAAEAPVRLTWTHVPPNMTYTVHRASEPYFTPAPGNQQTSLGVPLTDPIIYDDLTGSGNRFYAVVGNNAAGVGAPPDRVAVFNFTLQPGE